MIDYQSILNDINVAVNEGEDLGNLASYIPQLANVDPNKFGIHLTTVEGDEFSAGDANEKFSIQSISKVLSLCLSVSLLGKKMWRRVGVEPSGNPFNSLVQLEHEAGIPRNPFINAGALVVCDILISELQHPQTELLDFIIKATGNNGLKYNESIASSEKAMGFRNNALIQLMKDFKNIDNDTDSVLDLYFKLCSIEMTCKELANAFMFLAAQGVNTATGETIITPSKTKRINSIMQLCGFYDEAGEFSFTVGLPGKSGVGGGIVAIYPGKYSVAVWSPKLNQKGNSFKGMKALALLTDKTESSIF
jgi:glutaminase